MNADPVRWELVALSAIPAGGYDPDPDWSAMRRHLATPFHKVAHLLNRVGWWISEGPERKRKEAAIQAKAEARASRKDPEHSDGDVSG